MTTRTIEDSFKELGMKPPDLSFMKVPEKPGERFGREPLYNTRVLVGNWYEDRRQYKSLCNRCTGDTIYYTDYPPKCPSERIFPHPKYQARMDYDGEGWNLLRNTEDYCQYLRNYTTTYDLVHNWEVRRAGVKPRPWRQWKMVQGNCWVPQNDNTVSFGNLTQFGYRQAPQVPYLPSDWDLYGGNNWDTEYKHNFPKRRYPMDYTHCRKAPNKEVSREISDLTLIPKPKDPCDLCGESYLYQGGRTREFPCRCICHRVERCAQPGPLPSKPKDCEPPATNALRFGNLMPTFMAKEWPGKQSLYPPRQPFPYKALKHPPHPPPSPCPKCEPTFAGHAPHTINDQAPDICKEYAGDVGFDYKGPSKETPLCECFLRK